MLNKLMGMATAPNNIVASLGQPIHMDSAGNNDGFFKARQNNAGYRASVFANPMVREALCAHFNWSIRSAAPRRHATMPGSFQTLVCNDMCSSRAS